MNQVQTEPFSVEELASIRRAARAMGADFDLHVLARRFGRSSADTNLILDALAGRTPEDALAILEARPGPLPGLWGPRGAITAHIAEIFG